MKNRILLLAALFTLSLTLISGCGSISDEELLITGETGTPEDPGKELPEDRVFPEDPGKKTPDDPGEKTPEDPGEKTPEDQGETPEDPGEKEEPLYVYVVGAVNDPGVYGFKPGVRLFDVIERAGGFREDAAAESVNLAGAASDGSVVKVLTLEEFSHIQSASFPEAGPVAGEGSEEERQVNINTASLSELTSLNGIGESRAKAIISYRDENGAFRDKEDIKNVSGIKDGLYNKIKDRITV